MDRAKGQKDPLSRQRHREHAKRIRSLRLARVGDVGDGRSQDRSGGCPDSGHLGAHVGSARCVGFNRPDARCPCHAHEGKGSAEGLDSCASHVVHGRGDFSSLIHILMCGSAPC